MKILAAPIIHARTKNVDFRSGLFVKPENFSDAETQWARKHILNSTRFFELSGEEGRWLTFCDQKTAVAGVSIRINRLFQLCGKEARYDKVENKRTNYAFIGIAIPKSELGKALSITYPMLLSIYEKYMELRWEEAFSQKALEATKAKYESMEVPEADAVCDMEFEDFQNRQIYDLSIGTPQSIVSRMLLEMKNEDALSFCSDMPNERSIRDSSFTIVTSAAAKRINDAAKSREAAELNKKAESIAEPQNDILKEQGKSKIGLVIGIAIAVLAAVIVLLIWF